ncbi:hypothetical protein TNCV_469591 [Trichonephila clavipes]|nr:hypothetical protein TNCV_469591 [Trichonephila clavipes]
MQFRIVRAQVPPSDEETGSQNNIVAIDIQLYGAALRSDTSSRGMYSICNGQYGLHSAKERQHSTHKVGMTKLGLKTLNVVPCYTVTTRCQLCRSHRIPSASAFATPCVNRVTCWRTTLAMSSRVVNCLPRIGSLILVMGSMSPGEMPGEYGGCSNSSHPTVGVAAVRTLLYVVLHCCAGLLYYLHDPDIYPERHVVPVSPGSPCSTVRSLFCPEEQNGK